MNSHSIDAEHTNHLVPFGPFIWQEAEFTAQCSRQKVDTLFDFQRAVCLARQTTSEGVPRIPKGMPIIILVQNEPVD